MTLKRPTIMMTSAFLLGFGLGGVSLHYAEAQGLFGITGSVKQIGSALVEMQKDVDDLQKHMATIKDAKEQLASMSPESGETLKKKLIPGLGQ